MNLKTSNYNLYYKIYIPNKVFYIKKKNSKISLLQILLKEKVKLLYQCQEGYCGICRIKLKKGSIKYFKNDILAVKKKGYILPCCCKIISNIKILI
ncbi:class I ribonucleotide reductase maintenance protein YfaE [Buchnera aphidicola]|uniref:class I ribonucleotide reductase maintenance protein YfaE n=1 Tax=Buchnera aphidicola TaxID=9 RepID=UPI00346474B2